MTDLLPDRARPEPADPPGTPPAGPEYSRLVKPDRVHGSLYTDPRIFADELARIWYRTWVYVGHVSEIRQPGDYVRKSIGLQDVIMTRAADGGVHLLLNRCAHRANLVCEADRGNSKSFRCPYHGWTYRNTDVGDLRQPEPDRHPAEPAAHRQAACPVTAVQPATGDRSEEHTSELQSPC